MVLIDEKIGDALRHLTANHPRGQSGVARDCLGSVAYQRKISKYLSGEIQSMHDETWDILYPHLKPYLPPNYPMYPCGYNNNANIVISKGKRHYYSLEQIITILKQIDSLTEEQRAIILYRLQTWEPPQTLTPQ